MCRVLYGIMGYMDEEAIETWFEVEEERGGEFSLDY